MVKTVNLYNKLHRNLLKGYPKYVMKRTRLITNASEIMP